MEVPRGVMNGADTPLPGHNKQKAMSELRLRVISLQDYERVTWWCIRRWSKEYGKSCEIDIKLCVFSENF